MRFLRPFALVASLAGVTPSPSINTPSPSINTPSPSSNKSVSTDKHHLQRRWSWVFTCTGVCRPQFHVLCTCIKITALNWYQYCEQYPELPPLIDDCRVVTLPLRQTYFTIHLTPPRCRYEKYGTCLSYVCAENVPIITNTYFVATMHEDLIRQCVYFGETGLYNTTCPACNWEIGIEHLGRELPPYREHYEYDRYDL